MTPKQADHGSDDKARSKPKFTKLGQAVLCAGRQLRENGYVSLPGLLRSDEINALLEPTVTAAWAELPHLVGQVRQDAEELVFTDFDCEAQSDFVKSIAASPLVPPWHTAEVTYMRYAGGAGGITAHRDHARFVGVVAVASLTGQAIFRIHDDVDRYVVRAKWDLSPGDVVLMSGGPWHALPPGARPMHSLTASGAKPRISSTVRFLLPQG